MDEVREESEDWACLSCGAPNSASCAEDCEHEAVFSEARCKKRNSDGTMARSTPFKKAKISKPSQLSRFDQQFEVLGEPIGEGSFGSVFKVRERDTRRLYAVKRIHPTGMNSKRRWSKSEVKVLEMLRNEHYNCLQLEDHWKESTHNNGPEIVYIQTELCEVGDVRHFLDQRGDKPLSQKLLLSLTKDLLQGLKCIHSKNLIHVDIKPQNLLLTCLNCKNQNIKCTEHTKLRLKIGDYGITKMKGDKNFETGDSEYLSPELMSKVLDFSGSIKITEKVDIFSAGLVLLELAIWPQRRESKDIPRKIDNLYEMRYENIRRKVCGEDLADRPPAFMTALCAMIAPRPENRPSATELLEGFTEICLWTKVSSPQVPRPANNFLAAKEEAMQQSPPNFSKCKPPQMEERRVGMSIGTKDIDLTLTPDSKLFYKCQGSPKPRPATEPPHHSKRNIVPGRDFRGRGSTDTDPRRKVVRVLNFMDARPSPPGDV
eukprot:CAMPEP_0174255172 /NCGR_PEP_ID=MMETSP0439-20130205/4509_1 /TAXON_ID=0 /ORGANISM="Stereomyxa ramosa, Strain Chinc5" /LENGTH=486 /DNA_ID=CAMNT_0015337229 /DNA_START=78 /DNA_END=1538 /DNA_ORIENTATION=-